MKRLVAVAMVGIVTLGYSVPAHGQVPPADPELSPALQTVRDCVGLSQRLDVLMVIDESTSLVDSPGTDREGRRVDGMLGAIEALVELSEKSAGEGTTLDVNLMLAAFATNYTPVTEGRDAADSTGFVPVSTDTEAGLAAVAEEFRGRVNGEYTDFGVALNGSLESFFKRSVDQSSSGQPAPCKLLILFTDGALSVKGSKDVVKEELCRANGIADQTRSSEIVTIVVALTNPSFSKPSNDPGLLERVATGVDPSGTGCGTTGSPATGMFIPVADASELAAQLRKIFDGIDPPPPPPPPVPCRLAAPCVGEFDVPVLAEGFTLKGTASGDVESIELTAPDGATLVLNGADPISSDVSGADIQFQPRSDGGFRIRGGTDVSSSGVWKWSVKYKDTTAPEAALPEVTVSLSTDLLAVVLEPVQVRLGESTDVVVGIQRPSGPLGLVEGSSVSVKWNETGEMLAMTGPDSLGRWTTRLSVPKDVVASQVTLTVKATLPSIGDQQIPVRDGVAQLRIFVPGALVVVPSELVLPPLEGSGSTSSSFTVTAPPEAGGCVWFAGSNVTTPKGDAAELSGPYTSEATCLRVEAGTTTELLVKYTVKRAALGGARGVINVATSSDDAAVSSRTVPIGLSFEMGPPADWPFRLFAIVAAVLGFPLVALLVLHLVAVRGARFQQRNRIAWLSFDVAVDSTGIRLRESGQPVAVPDSPVVKLISKQDDRAGSFAHEGFSFIAYPQGAVKPSWRAILDGPFGRVQSGTGAEAVVSGAVRAKLWQDPEFRSNEALLGLRGMWLFRGRPSRALDAGAGEWQGQLLVLEEAVGVRQLAALVQAAGNVLPRQIRQMEVPVVKTRWWSRVSLPARKSKSDGPPSGSYFK